MEGRCGRCFGAVYCNRDCQRADWIASHKVVCDDPDTRPFLSHVFQLSKGQLAVRMTAGKGRGLFAVTDLAEQCVVMSAADVLVQDVHDVLGMSELFADAPLAKHNARQCMQAALTASTCLQDVFKAAKLDSANIAEYLFHRTVTSIPVHASMLAKAQAQGRLLDVKWHDGMVHVPRALFGNVMPAQQPAVSEDVETMCVVMFGQDIPPAAKCVLQELLCPEVEDAALPWCRANYFAQVATWQTNAFQVSGCEAQFFSPVMGLLNHACSQFNACVALVEGGARADCIAVAPIPRGTEVLISYSEDHSILRQVYGIHCPADCRGWDYAASGASGARKLAMMQQAASKCSDGLIREREAALKLAAATRHDILEMARDTRRAVFAFLSACSRN